MSIASGLGASFGVAPEVTYGTYVAPTRHHRVGKAELKLKKNTVQGGGLAAGQLVQPGSMRVVTSQAGEGSIELEISRVKMGLLLQHIMGSSAAPVQQGAGPAYLQTHAYADNVGKFLTGQLGVPDRGGVVRPYTAKGCKITSAEFSCKVDEILTLAADIDARQISEVETLAAPSYVADIPFHFAQMATKVGTYGTETAVTGVKGVSVKFERGQDTEAFYGGAAGLKAEPVINDWAKIGGTITADFIDKTVFADRFASDAGFSLIWEFVGPIIAATYAYTFRIKLPQCFLDGDTPTVDGPDVISGDFPFVVQNDGTNPIATIEYMTTDTTV